MSRLGKDIWADLEAAMAELASRIRAADIQGIMAGAEAVADLADELGAAAEKMRAGGSDGE